MTLEYAAEVHQVSADGLGGLRPWVPRMLDSVAVNAELAHRVATCLEPFIQRPATRS